MKMLKMPLFALLLINGIACSSPSKDEHDAAHHSHEPMGTASTGPVAELEKAVLATHDSAMADISELMRLKKEVKVELSNVATQAPSTEVIQRREQGMAISKALTKADATMMDWMNEYNGDTLAKLDQQKAMQYLNDQQKKVTAMRQLMLESIRNAKDYLK